MATKRRFEAKTDTILSQLRGLMTKMGATSLHIESNLLNEQGSATVRFDRGGRRYTLTCSKYEHRDDNLRACHLTIDYLWRALEQYGVSRSEADAIPAWKSKEREDVIAKADAAFEVIFLPFSQTPEPLAVRALASGALTAWHDVLGISHESGEAAIKNAYRALMRMYHPDLAPPGERAAWQATAARINGAMEEALAVARAAGRK